MVVREEELIIIISAVQATVIAIVIQIVVVLQVQLMPNMLHHIKKCLQQTRERGLVILALNVANIMQHLPIYPDINKLIEVLIPNWPRSVLHVAKCT